MASSGIPRDVEELIHTHVDSVDQLEVLLLLRARNTAGLTAADAARELRIDEGAARHCLSTMVERGLAHLDGDSPEQRYEYRPRTLALDGSVAGLALAYPRFRVAVITLIVSKPSEHIRSFADAFKFRRDK